MQIIRSQHACTEWRKPLQLGSKHHQPIVMPERIASPAGFLEADTNRLASL
jgi:hypothetical protein